MSTFKMTENTNGLSKDLFLKLLMDAIDISYAYNAKYMKCIKKGKYFPRCECESNCKKVYQWSENGCTCWINSNDVLNDILLPCKKIHPFECPYNVIERLGGKDYRKLDQFSVYLYFEKDVNISEIFMDYPNYNFEEVKEWIFPQINTYGKFKVKNFKCKFTLDHKIQKKYFITHGFEYPYKELLKKLDKKYYHYDHMTHDLNYFVDIDEKYGYIFN